MEKLTPEERKAVRNLIIYMVVKIGSIFAIQALIRNYLKNELKTNPKVSATMLRNGQIVPLDAERDPSGMKYRARNTPS